jgi:hypothetical protein
LDLGDATPVPATPVPAPVAVAAAPTAVPVQPAAVQAPAPSATAAPTPDAELSILGDTVNARQGPGTGFDIVGTLQQRQTYRAVGKTAAGDWWEVCCVSEQKAWVSASLSQVTNAQVVAVAADIPAAPTAEAVQPAPTAPPPTIGGDCPVSSSARFSSIPFVGPSTDIPAAQSGDFNLALRGYAPVEAPPQLSDYNGPTDAHAPQMPGLFTDHRTPLFTAAYQVHDWNRSCGQYGCPGPLLSAPPVTLLGMATTPGEPISFPSRAPQIYGGGYIALVLYADVERITLKYTREDSVVNGYTVHIENVCVDPALLSLYRSLDAAGRPQLPALHNGDILGTAAGDQIAVAINDYGTFMDPRSRKDWWASAR